MNDVFQYLSGLPIWVATPIIIITALATIWPKLYQIFLDMNDENKAYLREKRRLELLKLRYEIEIMRNSSGIEKIDVSWLEPEKRDYAEQIDNEGSDRQPRFVGLPAWQRLAYGSLGAAIPTIYRTIVSAVASPEFILPSFWFYLGTLLLVVVGGLASIALPKDRATPLLCAMVGMSVVFFIQMGASSLSEANRSPPNIIFPSPNIEMRPDDG